MKRRNLGNDSASSKKVMLSNEGGQQPSSCDKEIGCNLHRDRLAKSICSMRWLFEDWDMLATSAFELRRSGKNEIGVFSLKRIEEGQIVTKIPIEKIFRETKLPDKVQLQMNSLIETDSKFEKIAKHQTLHNLPLWIALIESRKTCEHKFHSYSSSLPEQSVDLVSWPKDISSICLSNTNALSSSTNLFSDLDYLYHLVTELHPICSFTELLWARGMCVSRSFPAHLIDKKANEMEPCLVPFIDLLNHKKGAKIKLKRIGNHLAFISNDMIEIGDEICNNYGDDKSNETLLWSYGFCVPDNASDTFSFSLGVPRANIGSTETTKNLLQLIDIPCNIKESGHLKLGPLHIQRAIKGGVPTKLLLMMAIISAEEEDLPNPDEIQDELDIAITADDILSLKNLFESKITALNIPAEQMPKVPEDQIHYSDLYRQGLIVVLKECIEQLNGLLQAELHVT